MKNQVLTLTEECWTIASFLHSAANKFQEIANDCRKPDASPAYASLASTFEHQKNEALRLAALFQQAEEVAITIPEDETIMEGDLNESLS